MFGYDLPDGKTETYAHFELWNAILNTKKPPNALTDRDKHQIYIENKVNSHNYYQKTIFPSRLPIFTFYDFQVNHDNLVKYDQINDIKIGPMNIIEEHEYREELSFLKSSDKHNTQNFRKRKFDLGVTESFANDFNSNVDVDVEGDIIMENFTNVGKISSFITLMIYHNSFSIDNGPSIPLTSPVLTASVIKAKNGSNEDTLLILLQSGTIVLIRFQYRKNSSNLKLKYTPYIVYFVPQTINIYTIEDRVSYRFTVSERENKVFLTSYVGLTLVFNIKYDGRGIPKLIHSHNFTTKGTIIDQCMVSLTPQKDLLLTLKLVNNILKIESIKDFETFAESSQLMKSSFNIPIFTIPLSSTQGVLFLQEDSFTIKSFLFCLGGEDIAHLKVNYSTICNDFTIHSYYIPKHKIHSESMNKYPFSIYNHDQILISTSNDVSVYILDIYFDKLRHKYSYDCNRLFKYKRLMRSFLFEPIENNQFKLIYSNEQGDSKSKLVRIIDNENHKPILQTISIIWDEINPYPILDYEVITSPAFKYSIENYQQEIWVLAGGGSNHSLMNLKNAYSSLKENLNSNDFKDIIEIYKSTTSGYYWLEGQSRLCLVSIDDNVRAVLELETNDKILSISELGLCEILITNSEILVFDKVSYHMKYSLKFPNKVTLATIMDDKIALVHGEYDDKKIFSMFTLSLNEDSFDIKDINLDGCLRTEVYMISMLKFIKRGEFTNLIIGTIDGIIDLYHIMDHGIELNVGAHVGVEDPKIKLTANVPDFAFVPYQIHELNDDENFIVSSKTGSYVLISFTVGQDSCVTVFKVIHLSDNGCLEIVETDNKDIIYLKGKYLWKLDCRISLYPERILTKDDLRDLPITCVVAMDGINEIEQALMIQNGELNKIEISELPSMLKRINTFGIPSTSLTYLPNFNLFSMTTLPTTSDVPPILFADHKSMKIFKIETDMSTIFNTNEMPTCIFEWSIPNGSMYHIIIVVGCKTKDGKGVIKLLKLSKNSQIQLKLLYTLNEENPVTNVQCYINDITSSSHLVYASGSNVYLLSYNLDTKKFDEKRLIFEGSSIIKKFYFFKENNIISLISCFQNNTSFISCFDPGLETLFGTKTLGEFSSDLVTMRHDIYVVADYSKETIDISNLPKKIDLMYLPRISPIDSFPPWVSLRERKEEKPDQFFTIGLNGQTDLIKGENKDIKDRYFFAKLCQLQYNTNCTIPIYKFMSKVHYQQLESLDTLMNARIPGDFSWDMKEKYLNSFRI